MESAGTMVYPATLVALRSFHTRRVHRLFSSHARASWGPSEQMSLRLSHRVGPLCVFSFDGTILYRAIFCKRDLPELILV